MSLIKLIAVDPSIRTAGVSILQGREVTAVYSIKEQDGITRIARLAEKFDKILEIEKPNAMAIESQFLMPGAFGNSILKVTESKGVFEGVFIAYCLRHEIMPVLVSIYPATAKLAVGVDKKLKRIESKKAVKQAVLAMYPNLKTTNQDIIDSISIGLAALYKGLQS